MSLTAAHDKLATPAADFGNVPAEFAELIHGCGLFDLSGRTKVSLTGSDRVRWLNGMVTNNIRDLQTGHGTYSFLLNPQGHILADLYAYNRGDSLLVDTDHWQAEKLLTTFDHYIIMDDVEVANISDKLTAVGVAGPKAVDALNDAGLKLPQLEPLQFIDLTWQGASLIVVRGDNPSLESYEFWRAPNDVARIWDALTKTGAKPVGSAALDLLRIASGIPKYGQDIRERDLPQETEQQRALNFNKGCYIGQEIVERIRSRGAVHRKFAGFEVEGPLPSPGTKIQADAREVGEVTSAATLPLSAGERRLALGYVRREVATPGKQLQAGDAQLTVATLPFARVFSGASH
jgi:folate-binding protein YgfZ